MSWFTKAYRVPRKRWEMLRDNCQSYEIIKEEHTNRGNVMVELEVHKMDAFGQLQSNRIIINKDWM